jgi:hypothetical protein
MAAIDCPARSAQKINRIPQRTIPSSFSQVTIPLDASKTADYEGLDASEFTEVIGIASSTFDCGM